MMRFPLLVRFRTHVLASALLATSCVVLSPAVAAPVIGEQAPSWASGTILQGAEGRTYRPEELRGQFVVLYFWFMNCSPCLRSMPGLNDLAREYRDDGVQFLGVTFDEPAGLQPFLREFRVGFPVIPDPGHFIIDSYAVRSFPSAALIDPEGTFLGFFPSSALDLVISRLLEGKDVASMMIGAPAAVETLRTGSGRDALFEFLIARSAPGTAPHASFSNSIAEVQGYSVRSSIAMMAGVHESQVVSDLELDTLVDFSLRVDSGMMRPNWAGPMIYSGVLIAAMEQTFNLRIQEVEHAIPCIVISSPSGRPGVFAPPSSESPQLELVRGGIRYDWANTFILAHSISARLDKLVIWEGPGLEPFSALLQCDPMDPDSILKALEEQWGLSVESGSREMKAIHVTRETWPME